MKIMVDGTTLTTLILVVLLSSFICDSTASFSTPKNTCSWSTWSPWDCSCCGNSVDQAVYRVRTQCCPLTFACASLRETADKITSGGTGFLQKGMCMHGCTNAYVYNSNKCSSVVPTNYQNTLSNVPASCLHVCLGSLSTKVPSLPSSLQPSKATNRDMTRVTAAGVKSSTNVPPYSSNNTVPAKDDTERPSPGSGRSLSTKVPSLPSSLQPSKARHRDMTRVTAAGVKSSTNVPPYTSTETVSAKNQTGPPDIGNGQSLAMSSRLVLWIAVILTTVSCLLDLTPI